MALILLENEACKFALRCPYNSGTGMFTSCRGADPTRVTKFICDIVNKDGVIEENRFRSKLDETGKMKILLENEIKK